MAVVRLAQSLAIKMLATCVTSIDAGTSADSKIVIYEGAIPADPDAAITTEVALATFPLPLPAFGDPEASAIGATATAEDIPSVAASASSSSATPTLFARIYDRDDVALIDLDVTDALGTGAIKIDATQIVQGVSVTIVSLLISQRNK